MSPTERGLWGAVLSNPDDDFARLVVADYFEETGRAPLANFIRAQIRLSHCPPGHPHYADAVEAQSLAVAAARGASSLPAPKLPEGATFAGSIREVEGDNYGSYERGFASRVTFSGLKMRTQPGDLARALTRIVATTAVRGLDLVHVAGSGLAELLACPATAKLTGLGVTHLLTGASETEQLLAACPHLAVRQLALTYSSDRYALVAWQNSHEWADLSRAAWLAGVTRCTLYDWMLTSLSPTLGPAVTSLTLLGCGRNASMRTDSLRRGQLDSLRHLALPAVGLDDAHARTLAQVPLPKLASFYLTGPIASPAALWELHRAAYLDDLTELAVTMSGASFLANVICEPFTDSLRLLYLDDAVSDGDSLAALARPGRFARLTTLSAKRTKAARDGGLARFAEAWRGEGLHTLILDGWPAPAAALQRLATNPAFASLRRLKLARCGVSDAGGVALARSPHLQNLVELDVSYNSLAEKSAALFLDPGVMPKLVLADLTTNKMHPDTRTRLRASRVGMWA